MWKGCCFWANWEWRVITFCCQWEVLMTLSLAVVLDGLVVSTLRRLNFLCLAAIRIHFCWSICRYLQFLRKQHALLSMTTTSVHKTIYILTSVSVVWNWWATQSNSFTNWPGHARLNFLCFVLQMYKGFPWPLQALSRSSCVFFKDSKLSMKFSQLPTFWMYTIAGLIKNVFKECTSVQARKECKMQTFSVCAPELVPT